MMKPSELIIIVAVLALGVGLTARFVMSPAQPATPFTEFSLPDTTDKPHNSTEWQGKIRIINFWATWCPPCRAEMPSINSLQSKLTHKDKVNFIMVDVDNKITSSVKYMTKHNYQLKVYSTVSAIPEYIFSGTLPTTLIVGPNGDIVFQHSGMADYDTTEMLNFINTISR